MFFRSLTLLGIIFHIAQSRPETGVAGLDSDDDNYLMETDETQFETDSSNLFKKSDPYDPNYTEKGHKPGKTKFLGP